MTNIFTIGYEGTTLVDFVRRLMGAGVDIVVDVRELPLSRRKGFSKTPLSAALEKHGIRYVHHKELGAPRTIRHELRESGDYGEYFRRFNAYLRTQRDVLRKLINEFDQKSIVLMCFEANPAECHRSSVARELGRMTHLVPNHLQMRGEAHHGRLPEASRLHTGQGVSAA
jgi:uncharacterized protein (DUF488 family)